MLSEVQSEPETEPQPEPELQAGLQPELESQLELQPEPELQSELQLLLELPLGTKRALSELEDAEQGRSKRQCQEWIVELCNKELEELYYNPWA